MAKKISQLRATTCNTRAQQTSQHASQHWSGKGTGAARRSLQAHKPHVNQKVASTGHSRNKNLQAKTRPRGSPEQKRQATTGQSRSGISRLANPNHDTTIFSQGVPNCVIISDSRTMKKQDAKKTMPLEAFTAMHITLPRTDAFHDEPLIFRLQEPRRSYEREYKPKIIQHQEEAYNSKSKDD